jgi:hypothetical protein
MQQRLNDTSLRTDGAVTAGTLDDYRGTGERGAQ